MATRFTDKEIQFSQNEAEDYAQILEDIENPGNNTLKPKENSVLELICIGNAAGVGNIISGNPSGGFILNYNDRKIIVDPGANSLSLIDKLGINAYELTDAIITHAHNDHAADMTAAVSAVLNIGMGDASYKNILINPGLASYTDESLTKYGFTLQGFAWKGNVHMMYHEDFKTESNGGEIESKQDVKIGEDIHVKATKCIHSEHSGFGVVFDLPEGKLGYTGDTEYYDGLGEQFQGCDVLWANLNTFGVTSFSGENSNGEDEHVKNHLGYVGLTKLVKDVKPSTLIVSHFGIQLMDKTDEISEMLSERYPEVNVYSALNGANYIFENLSKKPSVER